MIIEGKSLHDLAAMPHGVAASIIRRTVDPLWGFPVGELIAFEARARIYDCDCDVHSDCCRLGSEIKTIKIEAEDVEQARDLADRQFEHLHGQRFDDVDVRPVGCGTWL